MYRRGFTFLLSFVFSITGNTQDSRTQYPPLIANSSFGVNMGHINYPFSSVHLEKGFTAESVRIPHFAVRITLLDHPVVKNLSLKITYMRPQQWVSYHNVNGDGKNHSVWMNCGGISLRSSQRLGNRFSFSGEVGLAVVTRHGFKINNRPAINDAVYATLLAGAGLNYHINKKWGLNLTSVYAPGSDNNQQPHTIFYSLGFSYTMQKITPEKVNRNADSRYVFPKRLLQIGFATNRAGHAVNHFLADGKVAVFWGGNAWLGGLTFHYQRNIFHTRRFFSFDWGFSIGLWESEKQRQPVFTASIFPLFRFFLIRSNQADFYFHYAVPGPTYISRKIIDKQNTGEHFTFQDLMGIGSFWGKQRKYNAEIRIGHYSNGNIFTQNAGVGIPLTFCLGYTF